jgi:hypothetical protein
VALIQTLIQGESNRKLGLLSCQIASIVCVGSHILSYRNSDFFKLLKGVAVRGGPVRETILQPRLASGGPYSRVLLRTTCRDNWSPLS